MSTKMLNTTIFSIFLEPSISSPTYKENPYKVKSPVEPLI